jgi:hypothetical protein
LTVKNRVFRRVTKLRRTINVDTQKLRRKAIKQLDEIFSIACDYARGTIANVTEDGKERPLTIPERQFWARIAAYTAQILNSVAKGIDERQIDLDLDELARLTHEGKAKSEAKASQEAARDAEQAKAAS